MSKTPDDARRHLGFPPLTDTTEPMPGLRLARLEGRMDRIEDKLDAWLEAGPIVAAFVLGASIAWAVAR